MALSRSRAGLVAGAVLLAAIAAATLIPAGWQIRLGLHWLVEHFLAYLVVTGILCIAWPRPMKIAAVLVPFAIVMELLQGLTPDRVPDALTALIAASAVASSALIADFLLWMRRKLTRVQGERTA
jgi:hypothetical protein